MVGDGRIYGAAPHQAAARRSLAGSLLRGRRRRVCSVAPVGASAPPRRVLSTSNQPPAGPAAAAGTIPARRSCRP